MKRIVSLIILATLLFNLGGYYFLFKVLQTNAHLELVQQLDNNQYEEDNLVEIKLPFALPYSNYAVSEYKRVNGRIEHKGSIYKLVKQKLEKDTLYILAVKDVTENKLISQFDEFSKKASDIPFSSKKDSGQLLKQLQKEYNSQPNFNFQNLPDSKLKSESFYFFKAILSQSKKVPTPPPQS